GGNIAQRGTAISKAIAILGELTSSLDQNAGGAISANLEQLYSYMTLRLTEGNVRQQDAPLAEVESLLVTLDQAWQEARTKQAAAQPTPAPAAPATPAA